MQTRSRELSALRGEGRDRQREIDLLRFQSDEIEAAAVEPGEDERLKAERERLRHAEKLVERVAGAAALLSDEASGGGLDALRAAARLLAEAESVDPRLAAAAARLAGLTAEADDLLACCAPTSTISTSTRPTATPSSCATTSSRCWPASTAARPTR